MSQVLYLKYRPKLFSEVIGQDHITKTLENQVSTGKHVHSYIFTGGRGIGKTTVARLLAKALNCTERKEGQSEPCGKCVNCLALQAGNSLSIVEIDAASHTGVQDVRDKIIENARFAPAGAKYKIFIIDEAHMLSGAAFNALLKTLEEPPEYIVFVLATTEIHKIPATILSRCQKFDFRKPTIKDIVKKLEIISEEEKIKIDKSILERIAYLSMGGMRDAESLLGQILSLGVKDIKNEDADIVLPKSDFAAALDFFQYLVNKDGRNAIISILSLGEAGISFKHFFDNVIEIARKALFYSMTGQDDEFLPVDINKKISVLAESAKRDGLLKILDILLARRVEINNLDIPSLPLEMAVAEICGEESRETECETAESQNNAKEKTSGSREPNSIGLEEIRERWQEVLNKVKDYNHSLPFVLNTATLLDFDGKTLLLGIRFKLHKEKLEDGKNREILTNILKSVYNKDILIVAKLNETPGEVSNEIDDEIDVENEFKA
ncbi:DNA polymerase III subunit gamma/tau [Candidatus Parcubacteria bacterium]|nr:DNA polymerase III subunit gamma/tau [Patescibacteria group bacterium]MCG2693676.1 DNA polymerase III subunit gamma/tau [Candidatus Parcubacteria bacterium]